MDDAISLTAVDDSPSCFEALPWMAFEKIINCLSCAELVKVRAVEQYMRKQCTEALFERMAKMLCTLDDWMEELWRRTKAAEATNDEQTAEKWDANWYLVYTLHTELQIALKEFYNEITHPNAPFLYGTV
jgi:hypothetical protein